MKLTPNQIEQLYIFTRQHYVEYYDLQTELVDHLANAIEEQWQENPKLSFETALQKEFSKFGVFGFMDVVEKRQSAMNKKYSKIVWQNFKTFFGIPQIIGTFSAIVIVFYILKQLQGIEAFISIITVGLFVWFYFGLYILLNKKKKQFKQTGKKYLLDEIINGYSTMSGFGYLIFQIMGRFTDKNYGDLTLWFSSFFIVSFVLMIYIILFLIPSKAEEYLKETYPEYELAK